MWVRVILVLIFLSVHFIYAANITATLDSADGSSFFSFRDSDNVEIAFVDSDGNSYFSQDLDVRGAAVFNDNGADNDFRIEGDTDPNLVFVDASLDRVGIGVASPSGHLHAKGDIYLGINDTTRGRLFVQGDSGNNGGYLMLMNGANYDTDYEYYHINSASLGLTFGRAGEYDMVLTLDGNIGIGTTTPDGTFEVVGLSVFTGDVGIGTNSPGAKLDVRGSAIFNEDGGANDFKIEGGTETNLFYVDGSADGIGIGTNTPGASLEVYGSVKMFGAWESKSFATNYLAETDGFVVAYVQSSDDHTHIYGYTDNTATPSTLRCADGCYDFPIYGSITMPVRKGDYWKVTVAGDNTNQTVYWIPLGQ